MPGVRFSLTVWGRGECLSTFCFISVLSFMNTGSFKVVIGVILTCLDEEGSMVVPFGSFLCVL